MGGGAPGSRGLGGSATTLPAGEAAGPAMSRPAGEPGSSCLDVPVAAAVREGLPLVVGLLSLAAVLAPLDRRLAWPPLAAAAGVAAFFRDPPRHTPADDESVYAAADGVVLAVDRVDEPWHLHGPALRVVTFLSLFDVHVNRSPVAGALVRTRHIAGRFAPALDRAGSECNERQLLAIDGRRGPLVVAQVAGALARRIVRWVEPGAPLRAGQKLGMIRFGSRTDVLIPHGQAAALVAPGDRVKAGITPIARYLGRGGAVERGA